jgi:hypothetical protein
MSLLSAVETVILVAGNRCLVPYQDGTEAARAAVRWVYNVARELLPLSSGAYGADSGPDPRDAAYGRQPIEVTVAKHRKTQSRVEATPNQTPQYIGRCTSACNFMGFRINGGCNDRCEGAARPQLPY